MYGGTLILFIFTLHYITLQTELTDCNAAVLHRLFRPARTVGCLLGAADDPRRLQHSR